MFLRHGKPLLAVARTSGHLGVLLLMILLGAALFAPHAAPYAPVERFQPFLPPSPDHWLGSDDVGHDIFSQLLYAGRSSLLTGLAAAFAAVVIGTGVGIASGYPNHAISLLFQGFTNIVLLVPVLPLLITLAAYFGPSRANIVLALALLGWCSTARVVEARILQLKELPFIEALIALGISNRQIIAKHILPNTAGVIAAKFILAVPYAMLTEASLSFLGMGDPLTPSWGTMLYYAFHRGGFANGLWYWYLPPGLCIALSALAFILLGFYLEKKEELHARNRAANL